MPDPLPLAASNGVELAKGVVWPLLVGLVLWRLFPTVRLVLQSRGFTVRVGGAEITVQQASEQIAAQLDDLRTQLSQVKADVAHAARPSSNGHPPPASPIAGVHRLSRVLWVDDHPQNNAFEMAALARQRVRVVTAMSTAEGLRLADSDGPWDVVVTDVGREENGRFQPDAGLQLIERLHERHPGLPVVVYTSAPTLARTRSHPALAATAGATASGTELLDILGRLGRGKAPGLAPAHATG